MIRNTVRNYTSTVPPERSRERIEEMLVEAGAQFIGKMVSNGKVTGVTFQLMQGGHPLMFRVPCRVEAVKKLLTPPSLRTWNSGYKTRMAAIEAQAERTAWRLMHDWVAVQLALIRLGQVEVLEVFLPYAYDSLRNKTFFEDMRDSGFKLLPAPQGAAETAAPQHGGMVDGTWRDV